MELHACCKKGKKNAKEFFFLEKRIKGLLHLFKKVRFKAGQILYYRGQDPCGVYALLKGNINLMKANRTSRSLPFHDCVLGLNHMVSETPYCSTAIAADAVEVVFLPKSEILKLMQEKAEVEMAASS